ITICVTSAVALPVNTVTAFCWTEFVSLVPTAAAAPVATPTVAAVVAAPVVVPLPLVTIEFPPVVPTATATPFTIADWVFSAVSPSTVVDVDAVSELFALLAALAVVVEVDASLPSADGSVPCVAVFAVVSEESDGAEASVEPVASSDAVVVEEG